MTRAFRIMAAVSAIAASLPNHAAEPAAAPKRLTLAIEGVTVIDVARGERTTPRTVSIVDGRIAAIDAPGAATIPPAAVRVDGRGRYLIPGLVDLHVHLFNNASGRPPNEWAFPLFVANGVTGVREMSMRPEAMPTVRRWRERVASGELVAPRVLAAGVAVGGGSADAARSRVRAAHDAGADFVKVFSEVPEPVWRAILDEAHTLHLPVYGHAPAEVGLLAVAAAGQRSDEHLMQAFEACSTDEAQWLAARRGLAGDELAALRDAQEPAVLAGYDAARCAETAAALARSGLAQVPTLVLSHLEAQGDRTGFRSDPRWPLLRPDEQARWERILAARTAADEALAAQRDEVSRRIVVALHAARVPILAGTDAPMPLVYPGYALHDELALLVSAALTPAEALRAATLGPAELLGLGADAGTVAVGKRADLVLLDEDPLARIENLRRIHAVVLDGRLLRRPGLDALLRPRSTD